MEQSGDPCPKCGGTDTTLIPGKPPYSVTHATGSGPKTTVRQYPPKLQCNNVRCGHVEELPAVSSD